MLIDIYLGKEANESLRYRTIVSNEFFERGKARFTCQKCHLNIARACNGAGESQCTHC